MPADSHARDYSLGVPVDGAARSKAERWYTREAATAAAPMAALKAPMDESGMAVRKITAIGLGNESARNARCLACSIIPIFF